MKYLILLLFFHIHLLASIATDERKIDIWFGNGVWNDEYDAAEGKVYLQNEIIKRYVTMGIPKLEQKYLPLYLAYNQNDSASIDLIETFYQMYNAGQMSTVKYFTMVDLVLEQGNIPEISGQDFAIVRQMMLDYVRQTNLQTLEHIWNVSDGGIYNRSFKPSHRVLYISHSQGGLFANQLYQNYIIPSGYAQYFANLQIATPASYIASRDGAIGEYVTNCIDPIVNPLPGSLSCNATPGFGHTLINSYLSIGADSIVARGMIVDYIENMLVSLDQRPSQWRIESNYETNICEERRSKLVHFKGAVTLVDKVFPFNTDTVTVDEAERYTGKVYQVPDANGTDRYVLASGGGTQIVDVEGQGVILDDNGNDVGCYQLDGTGDEIKKSCGNVSTTDGVITVDLTWKNPQIDMELSVTKDDAPVGTLELEDIDCPREYFFITENKVEEGKYLVSIGGPSASGVDADLLPESIRVNIEAPDGGIDIKIQIPDAELLNMGPVAYVLVKMKEGGVSVAVEPAPEFKEKDIPFTAETYKLANGHKYEYKTVSLLSKVELGPIANAYVEVTPLEGAESGSVIHTGYTSSGDTLETTGLLLLPNSFKQTLSDDSLYLVSATGGEDVDADDDLNMDTAPTSNYGTIHAVVTGRAIKANGLKLNIMTEIGYQVSKELLDYPEKREEIIARLDDAADVLFEMDVNDDGVIDHADLHAWVPSFDKPKLLVDYNGKIHPIVLKIYNAEDIYEDARNLVYPSVPPVANAGTDQTVSFGESVTLDGSGSYDSDGYIIEYLWREGDKIYCSGDIPKYSVEGLTAGIHFFELIVKDDSGAISSDSIQVDVNGEAFEIGTYDTPGFAKNVILSGDGTVAYMADYYKGGLQIIDISNPQTPSLIGSYKTWNYVENIALSADETIVFVANGYGGLLILDVSDPSAPFELGKYYTPDYATDVSISLDGSIAYITSGYKGLEIIDISNPAMPSLIANYDTPDMAWGVTLSVDGEVAYVADGGSGLQIIDVKNPRSPYVLGIYNTSGFGQSVTLSADGSTAFLADGANGLQIIDVKNPSSPSLTGSYDTSGYTQSVVLSEDETIVYVVDWNGLHIIDVSNLSSALLIESYDTTGSAVGVALSADNTIAYIAARNIGLQIIDVSAFAH